MLENLDKKQKLQVTITAIGIVFLIFLIAGNVQKSYKKRASIIDANTELSSFLSAPISLERKNIEESLVKQDWGRDPFFPSASMISSSDLGGVVLNGIVWDKENPYAIINDDVVKVGDTIGDIGIVEINEKSVTVEQDGKKYTLELNVF